jgi:hypothetical protein
MRLFLQQCGYFPTGQWSNHVAAHRREGEKRYEENDKTSSGCPKQQDKREEDGKWLSLYEGPLPDKVV